MFRRAFLVVHWICFLGLGGCGGGSQPSPADAGADDAGAVLPPQKGTKENPMPADLSCVGMRTAPSPGAPVRAQFKLQVLPGNSPVTGAMVELFPGLLPRERCDGDCVMVMTNNEGIAEAMLPGGGWFAFRADRGTVMGTTMTVPTIGHFYTWPMMTSDPPVTGTAIGQLAVTAIAAALNREFTPSAIAISGSFRDCTGQPVANVRFRLFRGSMEIVSGAREDRDAPILTGLGDQALPMPSMNGLTGFQGRFAGVVPNPSGSGP
ncbi:MAG: hypothetical protein RMJ84_13735, partial [Sandaracinaceae bacterium]|nr:hypothetical protein [Sandaracinaceae bacterium]